MCMQTCPCYTICKVNVLVDKYIRKRRESHSWDLMCVCVSLCECGSCLYVFSIYPHRSFAPQSPCQYCILYHLSGLAWGHRQSPVWLRLDFVVDQWDLGGQTVCHCILPCTLPKFCLYRHFAATCLTLLRFKNPPSKRIAMISES